MAGQSLGYQARGTAIPVVDRTQRFPVMPATVSIEQKAVDYSYSSVDEDGNGFPDKISTGIFNNRNKGQVVRVTSQAQTSFGNPSTILRVVNDQFNPAPVISKPSVVRVPSTVQNPSKIVRVVNPNQVSTQQQVVRLTNPNKKTVIQPTRQVAGYQVIKQTRRKPQYVQVGQSVIRSPYYSNYGQQQFVTRSPIVSSGRLDQFLGGLNTVRDKYGRLVVRGNRPTTSFAPTYQTVVVNDDLDDVFDDLDDLDDDTFVVDSASFGR